MIERLVIKADGGKEIGMGHLIRTSVLASLLRQYLEVYYLCNEGYGEGIEYLRHKGFSVKTYKYDNLINTMSSIDKAMILTDSYMIDEKYIRYIREKFELVMYIDDNADQTYSADLILNQNFGAETINIKCNKECKVLAGVKYLLVRSEFRMQKSITIKKDVQDILITVGGSDDKNVTDTILSLIEHLPYRFHVAIGPAFKYRQRLVEKYRQKKNIVFYKEPLMSELMKQCDMAISSCGSTIYELGIMGVPTIGMVLADNQRNLARRVAEKNMIYLINEVDQDNFKVLPEIVIELAQNYKLREEFHRLNINRFNKNGADLVIEEILKLISIKGGIK